MSVDKSAVAGEKDRLGHSEIGNGEKDGEQIMEKRRLEREEKGARAHHESVKGTAGNVT